jgi:hypothetical protein
VQETELTALGLIELAPVLAHGFKQVEGAQHVGLHERLRAMDGAIHMALCSKIEDGARSVLLEQIGHQLAIADIPLHENMSRFCNESRFWRLPAYVSKSRLTTGSPVWPTQSTTKLDPMNPAPPVTNIIAVRHGSPRWLPCVKNGNRVFYPSAPALDQFPRGVYARHDLSVTRPGPSDIAHEKLHYRRPAGMRCLLAGYAGGDSAICVRPPPLRRRPHQPRPQSLQTLRTVMQMGERAQAVLGNHDLHLLAVACGIRPAHRDDTLDDILNAPTATS